MNEDRAVGEVWEWEDTWSRVRGKHRASEAARDQEHRGQVPVLHKLSQATPVVGSWAPCAG